MYPFSSPIQIPEGKNITFCKHSLFRIESARGRRRRGWRYGIHAVHVPLYPSSSLLPLSPFPSPIPTTTVREKQHHHLLSSLLPLNPASWRRGEGGSWGMRGGRAGPPTGERRWSRGSWRSPRRSTPPGRRSSTSTTSHSSALSGGSSASPAPPLSPPPISSLAPSPGISPLSISRYWIPTYLNSYVLNYYVFECKHTGPKVIWVLSLMI